MAPLYVCFEAILLGVTLAATFSTAQETCSEDATRRDLPEGPFRNYFYSDCHSSSHVNVRTPVEGSDIGVITPRLLVAWPAGNSGVACYFDPEEGERGSLRIELVNSTTSKMALDPIYVPGDKNPEVGVSGTIKFSKPAILSLPILGSIRTIRAFSDEGNVLNPDVQDNTIVSVSDASGALERRWFDDVTTTKMTFSPLQGSNKVELRDNKLRFDTGTYQFNATFNYPQLKQISPENVLNAAHHDLIETDDETKSLSFLSTTDKLLAGSWRFLTYFGRDSMISLLLLQPILSEGEGGTIEAVIRSVLERINKDDGTVCHEEVIGDFASIHWREENNENSTKPYCDYKMIDTDFFFPVILQNYLVDNEKGRSRVKDLLDTKSSFFGDESGLTYRELAQLNAKKIMKAAAPFAGIDGQKKENLLHLHENEIVGQWRDSSNGLYEGKIPYDVNTALVPAALRSIAALTHAGVLKGEGSQDWTEDANTYAQIWEDRSLEFFNVTVPKDEASKLMSSYIDTKKNPLYEGPKEVNVQSDINFYALALDGRNEQEKVRVMNTDDCFRLFLSNATDSSFLQQAADHIIEPFPVGLWSDVGLFVTNPAYGGIDDYATAFTKRDYHGTVVWGWQLAMIAEGFARQLRRCGVPGAPGKRKSLHSCHHQLRHTS